MGGEQDGVVAEIFVVSADLDFAGVTVVFLRLLVPLREPLRAGVRIVARFFLEPARVGAERPTHEILYGILDQNIIGDLILITRTRNRLIPRHALIQPAALPRPGFSEAAVPAPRRDGV